MTTAVNLVDKYTSLLQEETKCKPGFKMQAGRCVRMDSKEKRNRSVAAKKSAKKRPGGFKTAQRYAGAVALGGPVGAATYALGRHTAKKDAAAGKLDTSAARARLKRRQAKKREK